jgi:hypothetical protein
MGATEDSDRDGVVAPRVFIVRAWRDAAGRPTGVVERVATGEKARFQGAETLAGLIQGMLGRPKWPPGRDRSDG